MRRDEEARMGRKLGDSMLPRKASKRVFFGARTGNRHRWVGRAFQGVEKTLAKELGNIAP